MKKFNTCAVLGFALIVASSTAMALAQTVQDGPIHLDNTQIVQSYGVFNSFEPGRVGIAFTNTNNVEATAITFNLLDADGNVIAQYNDVGSYRMGAAVHHNFVDTHAENNQSIEVARVTFADGTSWSAAERTMEMPAFPAS